VAAELDVDDTEALELIPDADALQAPDGRSHARSFSDDDVSFLQSVANIVAASVERARADDLARESQEQLTVARRRLMADALAAEERERQALAESLHDSAIQNLLSARHELEEAAETVEHAALKRADAALTSTISDLREAIFELHPYVLDEAGVDVAVRSVGERAARRGHFNLHCEVDRVGSHPNGRLLLSAARELLTNAVEHADAHNVTIRMMLHDARIVLEVEDDGAGFDADTVLAERVAEGHIGLASQRERVESAGGSFDISSSPGRGTRVVVTLPDAPATIRRGGSR
jgi:two-component system NarL family sensor kinase